MPCCWFSSTKQCTHKVPEYLHVHESKLLRFASAACSSARDAITQQEHSVADLLLLVCPDFCMQEW